MLISNNFATKIRQSIFVLGPKMHQAAPPMTFGHGRRRQENSEEKPYEREV